MKLTKREIYFIAFRRDLDLESENLKAEITELTDSEIQALHRWEEVIKSVNDADYSDFTPSEVVQYLSVTTRFPFPFPLSGVFTGNPGRKQILGFYQLLGYDIRRRYFHGNDQQLHLISTDRGCIVVNAGAGTGKTSTLMERAYRLKDEGVIIVSYSNATIQEIKDRFKLYPGLRGYVGFKEFTKKIAIATVDSLAAHICNRQFDFDNYTQGIINALTMVMLGNFRLGYQHLLIDEAQDIDDDRGQLIQALYATRRFKSLQIYGDPRQRICDGAGLWYTEMWKHGSYLNPMDPEIPIVATKIGLTVSYRFHTQRLLDFHNRLSGTRPPIHVELESIQELSPGSKIKCYNLGDPFSERGLLSFAQHLKVHYLGVNKYKLSEIAILAPSVSSDNATSRSVRRITAILKAAGMNCYTRQEGSFQPNAIFISTINSAKGREFRLVVLFGMSGYPAGYPIPTEIADSLIYVANTRAKEEIVYLYHKSFSPPRNIEKEDLDERVFEHLRINESPPDCFDKFYSLQYITEDHGWSDLVSINRYQLLPSDEVPGIKIIPSFKSHWEAFLKLGIKTYLLGHLPSNLQDLATSKITHYDLKSYNDLVKDGSIVYGRCIHDGSLALVDGDINFITREELAKFQGLYSRDYREYDWMDWLFLTQIYQYLRREDMNARYDLEIPTDELPNFTGITELLKSEYGELRGCDEIRRFKFIYGIVDLVFEHHVIDLKSRAKIPDIERHHLLIWNGLPPGCDEMVSNKIPVLYNLQTGILETVKTLKDPIQWRFLADVYCIIKNHTDKVTVRRNYKYRHGVPPPEIPPHFYTLDTEFEGEMVFDFSMVSLSNPFASIVQPIRTSSPFARHWISSHNPEWSFTDINRLFTTAPSDLNACFENLPHRYQARGIYFVAKMDSSLPESHGIECADIRHQLEILASRNGITNAQKSVNLGMIYDLLCVPIEHQKVLSQHLSLCDALMLWELVMMGYIKL